MSRVFLDANYLCALYNNNDSLHQKAKEVTIQLEDKALIISNFILLETYTVLSQRASKEKAVIFGNFVRSYNPYEIYWIEKNFEEEVWEIFKSIKDKNFSYVDASILAVIKKEKIKYLLTFDDYFKKLEKRFKFEVIC